MSAVTYHLGSMGGVMLLTMPLWLLLRTLWQVRKEQSPRYVPPLCRRGFCVGRSFRLG